MSKRNAHGNKSVFELNPRNGRNLSNIGTSDKIVSPNVHYDIFKKFKKSKKSLDSFLNDSEDIKLLKTRLKMQKQLQKMKQAQRSINNTTCALSKKKIRNLSSFLERENRAEAKSPQLILDNKSVNNIYGLDNYKPESDKKSLSDLKTISYIKSQAGIDKLKVPTMRVNSIKNLESIGKPKPKVNHTMASCSSEESLADESINTLSKYASASNMIRVKLAKMKPVKIDPFLNKNKITVRQRMAEKFTPVEEYLLGAINKDKIRN